ncbi:MAG: hypothetical protein KC766_20785 [Myxococcales bacterium]|nr:hypothetical protein [Myxococcales bacterium]
MRPEFTYIPRAQAHVTAAAVAGCVVSPVQGVVSVSGAPAGLRQSPTWGGIAILGKVRGAATAGSLDGAACRVPMVKLMDGVSHGSYEELSM